MWPTLARAAATLRCRIARRVAPGKVYAVDPSSELLEVIRGKLAADGAPENVELVAGEDSATGVAEASCDLIFLSARVA